MTTCLRTKENFRDNLGIRKQWPGSFFSLYARVELAAVVEEKKGTRVGVGEERLITHLYDSML